jgi:hypothetical protein
MTARGSWPVLALALVTAATGCASATFTVTKTRAELEEKLAPRFPVTKEKMLVAVTFSDPRVILTSGDPRVGLDLATSVAVPLRSPVEGRIAVIGRPHYDPAEKAFFLRDARIARMDFRGVNLEEHVKTRAALDAALQLALASTPIYTLEGRTFKETTARHLLKEVHVADGKLHFTLGL